LKTCHFEIFIHSIQQYEYYGERKTSQKEKEMNIRKDRKLLHHALAEGIRTAAELAAWLRDLDGGRSLPFGAAVCPLAYQA
jgi:hypothetical protein